MTCVKTVFLPMLTIVRKPSYFTSLTCLALCLVSLNVNKSCVHDIFPESPLKKDTQIIDTTACLPSVSINWVHKLYFWRIYLHECAFQKVSKLCILNFLTNTQVEINSKLNEQSQRIFLAFSSIHERTYKLDQNSSPQKSNNAIQHNPVHTTSHHFSRSRFRISTFFCLLGVDKSGELPISCSPV